MNLSQLRSVSITTLTGIGPKAQESYNSLGIKSIADLIFFIPKGYEDRTGKVCIGRQVPGGVWTNTIVKVLSKSRFGKGLKSVKVLVQDTENGVRGELLGFNRPYLDHVMYPDCYYHIYANQMPSDGFKRPQFSQFEIKPIPEEFIDNADIVTSSGILPVYPLSGCLTQKTIRRDIKNALSRVDKIEDDLPSYLMDKYHLMDRDTAIRKIQNPQTDEDIKTARRTLGFSEVFYLQLLSQRKPKTKLRKAKEVTVYQEEENFIKALPFKLTDDQQKVLDEIRKDMSASESMNRLLQGDVGCGKTLVAWVSAIHAIAEGNQVAFMAPTELLAKQHAQGAAKLFEKTGIRIAYLDGQVHGKPREALLRELQAGNIDLLIGTHALFSKDVQYKNLGYIIVDEQHRFGVEQRKSLFEKGQNPDILLMTATPIPRTLALTVYGNLSVSTIKSMPVGRLPIKTFLVRSNQREDMYKAVGTELERGHQAYFVYPRIENPEDESGEEAERRALKDVNTMYQVLSEKYPNFRGALIHSRLDEDEKIRVLNEFTEGKIRFLVSTSVVEVGIDVPTATCMVVEHADTFGLSALHQLRGRVGRSTLQSWCFLGFEDTISDDGKKRLSVLKSTNDGFVIAEEDLKIRGPGEITGLRQSGFNNLKYADLEKDLNMMVKAREEVSKILSEDPGLINLENAVIRQEIQNFGENPC